MHIGTILNSKMTAFSFEFFPPKDQKASEQLFRTIHDLTPLQPAYVSVTYGAGGSTRELTHELVVRLTRETNLTVIPHLTCVGSTKQEIEAIVGRYHDAGVENIMALRGDPPRGVKKFVPVEGGFDHASDLVQFIKQHFPDMGVGIAGYPEGHPATPNRLKEIEFFKKKVDAGADYICSQMFFDNKLFYEFCERCTLAGIHVPIIAGIMPVTTIKGMERMADSGGIYFPARFVKSIMRAENDSGVEKVGIHWATEQVSDLIDHDVRGIHFYTLNQSKATLSIYDSLGVTSSSRLGN